jgi:hypothetical protein
VSDQVSHPYETTGKIEQRTGRQKTVHRMIARMPWQQSALNLMLIC